MIWRNLACTLLCFLVLPGLSALPAQSAAFREFWDAGVDPARDCGAYCAARVIRRLEGSAPDMEEMRREVREDENGVTSLENLRVALLARGIEVGVRAASEFPRGLSIAFLTGDESPDVGHFVVLEPIDVGRRVAVYAPPFWNRDKQWDELQPQLGSWMLVMPSTERGPPWRSRVVAAGLGVAFVAGLGWLLRSRGLRRANHD